jgi:hypothetical protein
MAFILLFSSDFVPNQQNLSRSPDRGALESACVGAFYDSRHVSFNELFAVGALAKLMTRQPLSVRLISKWTATRSISVLSCRHRDQMTSTEAALLWYATVWLSTTFVWV